MATEIVFSLRQEVTAMNALTLMLLLATHETAQAKPLPEVRVQVLQPQQDMVIKWNEIALQAIRDDRSPPPIAARHLAIVHVSIYDAVMAITRTHQQYFVDATPFPGASPDAAAAAA